MDSNKNPESRIVHFVDESGGAWPWRRQLEAEDARWGNTQYYFGIDDHPDAQWLVVFSAWPQMAFYTSIPRERRIFVAGEPESFHVYLPEFLNQFGTVLTTQRGGKHGHTIHSQVGINWFAGVAFQAEAPRFTAELAFQDFKGAYPAKDRLCSVVCSSQTVTQGHRDRLAFVERLKHAFGDQIDFYGRGSRPMPDKDEALKRYHYHIALENSVHRDYWTEKLADPLLRGCYPIYSGCSNVFDYFQDKALTTIDISRPEEAIATIRQLLAQVPDAEMLAAMDAARSKILHEYNIFAVLENMLNQSPFATVPMQRLPEAVQLLSDHDIKNKKFSRRLRKFFKRLFS